MREEGSVGREEGIVGMEALSPTGSAITLTCRL